MTPFLRWLKAWDAHVILATAERGAHVLWMNPNVDEWVHYVSDSVPGELQEDHFKKIASDMKSDIYLNFSGCIEVALSPTPSDPLYSYPKSERMERCNRNFYEYMWEHVGAKPPRKSVNLRPDLHFTQDEILGVKSWLRQNMRFDERLMVVCWTGSGRSKQYPYMEYVVGEMLMRHQELTCVVVGNAPVDVSDLNRQSGGRICSRMTKWTFREACVAASCASVVVSMDTGILHASGAFQVPKVGIIGHNTLNNITKHFQNDFSIEADRKLAGCAPCHRIVHDGALQCPVDRATLGVWCMAFGIPPAKVVERIEAALEIGYGDLVPGNGGTLASCAAQAAAN